MSKSTRLVYSTDPELNKQCAKCKERVSECICLREVDPGSVRFTARLRIEKSGRSGKTVTVIDQLPSHSGYLKDLATRLKKRCGSGGTSFLLEATAEADAARLGVIEIQGDKRELVRAALSKEGIAFKG